MKESKKDSVEKPYDLQKSSIDIWLGKKEPKTEYEKMLKKEIEEIKQKGYEPYIPWDI